jgi:EAL domain-containing protein (putative c-di-GMP-specific phosphodiesterase class I)
MTRPVGGGMTDGKELIIQVRRLHEALTHRSINARFQPVVQLDGGEVYGYEAIREFDELPGQGHVAESIVEGTECRLTERINQQHRLFSVEQASQLCESAHLFLGLQVSEISAEFLPDSLDRLADIVSHKHQLVAQIPETAVCDIPYFRQFIQGLRDREIKVAYANFCGSPTQITGWHSVAPDYLKLSPSLVQGISRASGGWRTVQALIQATQQLGCAVIATGIDNNADVQCLVELGCPYGQGDYFGAPQPVNAFTNAGLVGIGQ